MKKILRMAWALVLLSMQGRAELLQVDLSIFGMD